MVVLSQRLYDIITDSKLKWKTIQFIAPNEVPNPFITYEENDTIEIGVTKKNYLKLFKEAHHYWHHKIIDVSNDYLNVIQTGSDEEIWNLYLCTIGYMITTNENHTIIRLHELLVFEIYDDQGEEFIDKELDLITAFLTSRLRRINKSSSLWFWIKKLTVLTLFNPLLNHQKDVKSIGSMLIDRAFRSSQLHFANYYASNYLRWFISVLGYIQYSEQSSLVKETAQQLLQHLQKGLQDLCRSNLRDVALWNLFEYYLITKYNPHHNVTFSLNEYNRIADQLSDYVEPLDIMETDNISVDKESNTKYIIDEISWLLKVKCLIETPYTTLLRPLIQLELHDELRLVRDMIGTKCVEEQELLNDFDDKDTELFKQKSEFVHTLSSVLIK
ncbi:hypothetical protein DFJ63DRAFT_316016 [Scheffersomyces coipomensis]|uniref:uncharacterized protein n=1 Tax=Scheffersomyces coipomensis TaxID=1788519 RepID=UPI00315C8E41